jgi:hypothetical protein
MTQSQGNPPVQVSTRTPELRQTQVSGVRDSTDCESKDTTFRNIPEHCADSSRTTTATLETGKEAHSRRRVSLCQFSRPIDPTKGHQCIDGVSPAPTFRATENCEIVLERENVESCTRRPYEYNNRLCENQTSQSHATLPITTDPTPSSTALLAHQINPTNPQKTI